MARVKPLARTTRIQRVHDTARDLLRQLHALQRDLSYAHATDSQRRAIQSLRATVRTLAQIHIPSSTSEPEAPIDVLGFDGDEEEELPARQQHVSWKKRLLSSASTQTHKK